ncbi:signal transduction histidine kinase [Azonexus fungiphilus]|uniref:histidine kinase n=1 Tax=Azonexus fungiphilus TaxID=146940 RepID=A0A495VMU6_9RHOO|nr:ATP-binding protein [Azonexus fungiphilus]RKT50654.1 signal transduction histidine kinase [Azonexus fungiphilus]
MADPRALLRWLLGGCLLTLALLVQAGEVWHAQIAPGRVMPAQVSAATWAPVPLDDSWRRQKPCRSGDWTYASELWLDGPPGQPYGIFIHRAGNRLHLWLNGTRVAAFGDLDNPRADYSNAPLYAQLPVYLLRPGSNQILIQVAGDCRRYAGLSHFEIDSHEVLEERWRQSSRMFAWQSAAIISICCTLSLVSFGVGIWRRDRLAMLLAVASAFWALRAGLWAMNELPVSYELWFFLIDFCYGIWMVLIALLATGITGVDGPFLRRLQWCCLAFFCATSIASALGAPIYLKALGIDVTVLGGFAGISRVWYEAFRRPNGANVAISIAGVFMLILGLIDHWNVWFSDARDAYQRFYYTPSIVLFFILSIGVVLARRFDHALKSEARYRESLEQEVKRQRAELERSYREAQAQIRQEAVDQERQRIVREMHDGLGSQLVGILSSVRHADAPTPEVEREIQEALDQLRYTMDTLSGDFEDLSTVLAQFRFRSEARLKRAGIVLNWTVRPLPPGEWEAPALLHFERILREALANILKHAGASEISVDAGCDGDACHIAIRDNGRGCDPATLAPGRGLRHMRERARELGIALTFTSAPGDGATITLSWRQTVKA